MSETLFGAIVGAIIGSGLTIIAQWWWERRTRWLEQRRDAYITFLFAIDDFIGSLPAHPDKGHMALAAVGRSLYRGWTEVRIVSPTKGRAVLAADAALANAMSLSAEAYLREAASEEQWRAFQSDLMTARGAFFEAIREDLGLGPIRPDPFREAEEEIRAAKPTGAEEQR